MMHRKSFGRRAFLGVVSTSFGASALGRTPHAGRLRLGIPWPITSLDPAALNDGFSASFAAAVFEPLFATDASGKPYPALASKLPSPSAEGVRISLRPGLRTGSGRALSGADVLASVERARTRGAAGLLGEVEPPRLDAKDPLSVIFPKAEPEQLSLLLASPLLAVVPRGFSPLAPDGTGAFRMDIAPGRALMTRNMQATRGPAYLDAVEISAVTDLAELLRGFEAGSSDVGWFGAGLYRAVKDAVPFDTPRYGFAVLASGRLAGAWGAPGTLQTLLDGVAPEQLRHLGLRGLPNQSQATQRWGGPTIELAVPSACPQLLALARALVSTLSTPGHELRVVEKPPDEIARLRVSRQFGLMLDFVRSPGLGDRDAEHALRTAVNPEAAKRAPKVAAASPRQLARSLPLGVVGELTVHGARKSVFQGLESWNLGAVWLKAPTA